MRIRHSFKNLLDSENLYKTVPPGARVLVGVSGGADSVALLRALLDSCGDHLFHLAVVHVNHRLRPEAESDQAFVESLCDQFGVPCYSLPVREASCSKGQSPEQLWKNQRYSCFREVATEFSAEYVALAHTADDMAETFLFHLTRGTGINGLIFEFCKESNGFTIVRPFWKTKRSEIEQKLLENSQAWCEDSTNSNIRFSRNLIRHQVLPHLRQINEGVVNSIISFSEDLRALNKQNTVEPAGSLKTKPLRLIDPFEAGQTMRQFISAVTGVMPTRKQIEQALQIISSSKTGLVALGSGWTLVITQDEATPVPVDQPGDRTLAEHYASRISTPLAEIAGIAPLVSPFQGLAGKFDFFPATTRPLLVRNRVQGDVFEQQSLKRILIEFKIPWFLRNYMVFVCDSSGKILDLAGEWNGLRPYLLRRGALEPLLQSYEKASETELPQ